MFLLLKGIRRIYFRSLSKQPGQNGKPPLSRYTTPSKVRGVSVNARILAFSALISLSAFALYANEITATNGTLTTCNNGITISFMISIVVTQIFIAVFIGRLAAHLKGIGKRCREPYRFGNCLEENHEQ